jgi:hypothetical protein
MWSMAKRTATHKRIEKEAARAAPRLGANYCIVIACFRDPDGWYNTLDASAGIAPMSATKIYSTLVKANLALQANGGEDVEVRLDQ